jgi:hypothetical protein
MGEVAGSDSACLDNLPLDDYRRALFMHIRVRRAEGTACDMLASEICLLSNPECLLSQYLVKSWSIYRSKWAVLFQKVPAGNEIRLRSS